MKKILLTLWISSLIPSAAFAEGSFFGDLANRVFSGTAVEQVAAPATGDHLSNQVNNVVTPQTYPQNFNSTYPQNYNSAYPQNYNPMPTTVPNYSQQQANEDLVRCTHLADIISTSTTLADEEKARSTGKVYAGLRCNDLLKDYSHVIQQVDQALNTCFENDNCGNTTINQPLANSGGLKK